MMKSILFALAAVFAVGVQAITLSWKDSGTNAGWQTSLGDNPAFIGVVYADTASDNYEAIASVAKGIGALKGFVAAGSADAIEADATLSNYMPSLSLQGFIDTQDEALKGKHTYIVIFDEKDEKYAVGYIDPRIASDAWLATGSTGGATVDVTFNGTAVVPEPTALALLALGIAGLALRRRA